MRFIKFTTQILALLIMLANCATAQLANWTPGGGTNFPTNSSGQINGFCRISQMKFHPTDPNKLYAVTAEGGLFTTSDGGDNWTVKSGTESLTNSWGSLCIDYTNDQTIYLGSGDANYYSNGNGVYKSTDGGNTFVQTSLTNCLVISILQDPSNPQTFVAATNKGIYKSTDNAVTWVLKTSNTLQFCDLEPYAGTSPILFACTRENSSRLYRSIDYGDTWTQITSGITTSVNFIQAGGRIAVTPADTNVVYFEAIGGGGILHKSTDGGLNFTVTKPEGVGTVVLPYITFYDYNNANGLNGQGNYNNCMWVDVNDASKVWIQSHNTWLSTNSGSTWTEITHWSTKLHTDMHQLMQSPFDPTKLYSCNDGGVWLSTDGGNNWTPKSNGLYAYEVANNAGKSCKTRKDYVIIGTQDNGKIYRNAAGWFTIGGGDDYEVKEYDYLPNGGYFYNKDHITRTKAPGGGSSTYGLPAAKTKWQAIGFNRSNVDVGFLGDTNIYRTINLSASTPAWTQISTFSKTIMAVHSCIADINKLYVITSDQKLYVSSDAMTATPTFTLYNLPSSSNSLASIASIANNSNTVYISINSKVYVSTNSGVSWTDITYNLPNVNHRRILAEDYGGTEELVFIATNNAVYYKKAGQTSWTNYSTNLPGRRAPTDFSMFDNGTNQSVIRYATYGRGIWETSFGNLRTLSASIDVPQSLFCNTGSPITYMDNSTGNITSWLWSFPGGTPSTSTLQNPIVTYSSPGYYGAILTVSDGITTSTISRPNIVLVMNGNPTLVTGCTLSSNSNLGNAFGIGIQLFSLNTIQKGTSGNNGFYNDYTCTDYTSLEQGGTYNATITTGTTNPEGAKVYIDYDDNGIFASSEAVITYPSNNTGTRTLSFTVPTTGVVLNKGLRMRVISKFNSAPSTACDVGTYGQAEDYTVFIQPVPIATLSNGTGSSTICIGQFANLKADIVGGTSPYTVIVSDGTTSQTVNNYVSGTDMALSPIANATYSLISVLDYFGTSIPVTGTASIAISSFNITASAGTNGSITPSGITNANCGTNQTYNFTPNSGYAIQDVVVDGISQGVITSYTFTNVTTPHTIHVNFVSLALTLSLKLYLQGYYLTAGMMQPVLSNQGVSSNPSDCDIIPIELHEASTPYSLVETVNATVQTNGMASCSFTSPSASYFIVIKHRNTIETWSADPIFISSNTNYDFSTAANKAYGSNLIEIEPGIFALYTGDLNQDGYIDGFDYPAFDIDSQNNVSGVYVATDMNGDGYVDGFDYPVFDLNSQNNVVAITP